MPEEIPASAINLKPKSLPITSKIWTISRKLFVKTPFWELTSLCQCAVWSVTKGALVWWHPKYSQLLYLIIISLQYNLSLLLNYFRGCQRHPKWILLFFRILNACNSYPSTKERINSLLFKLVRSYLSCNQICPSEKKLSLGFSR